jgi:hypothetical protein
MRTGRRLLPVSSDNGLTYKKRWISVNNFNPTNHDLVKIGDAIHKTVIRNGKLDCPLVKCADDEHDWENDTWYKRCKKCSFKIEWILA